MQLPEELSEAIEMQIASFSTPALRKAAEQMMESYRKGAPSGALFQDEAARLAYLAMRLSATYAAIHQVLFECIRALPHFQPKTFLDLGAGPGTGSWAAADIFSSLEKICLIEQSEPMLKLGQKLSLHAPWSCLQEAKWICAKLQSAPTDVALLSYVIAEIPFSVTKELLEKLWADAQLIIVIEPGTPAGYERILAVRDWALSVGAELIAPCPHKKACPMKRPDWCHFPARVERTRLHKLLKGGSLGYEDEKFSYVAFGKIPLQSPQGRIVGLPSKASGLIHFPLCTRSGILQEMSVSRREDRWKIARKTEWGDRWE